MNPHNIQVVCILSAGTYNKQVCNRGVFRRVREENGRWGKVRLSGVQVNSERVSLESLDLCKPLVNLVTKRHPPLVVGCSEGNSFVFPAVDINGLNALAGRNVTLSTLNYSPTAITFITPA